jgi:hypothetical protein
MGIELDRDGAGAFVLILVFTALSIATTIEGE